MSPNEPILPLDQDPAAPASGSGGLPPGRSRSGWYTLVRLAPAILFTIAYAVLEHRYYAGGGRDALNSLSNGIMLLPLGLIASGVVGIMSAGWAVRDRPPHRSAGLVWTATFLAVVLLNVCLMFGGCLSVLKIRS